MPGVSKPNRQHFFVLLRYSHFVIPQEAYNFFLTLYDTPVRFWIKKTNCISGHGCPTFIVSTIQELFKLDFCPKLEIWQWDIFLPDGLLANILRPENVISIFFTSLFNAFSSRLIYTEKFSSFGLETKSCVQAEKDKTTS